MRTYYDFDLGLDSINNVPFDAFQVREFAVKCLGEDGAKASLETGR
jgi:hypothetical protein